MNKTTTVGEMELAFPAIQDDDLFGGFVKSNSVVNSSEDPFASAIDDKDPFVSSNFPSRKSCTELNNPFWTDNVSKDDLPSSRTTSGAGTPIGERLQSVEVIWPGNNTIDSSEETSRDSAEVDSSVDIHRVELYSRKQFESSDSMSDRDIPNIALDSDSGNLTADVNESVPISNAVYGFIEVGKPNLQIPKVIFTEATIISDKSSSFDVFDGNSAVDEGQTRLLESTEGESSENLSQPNHVSLNEGDEFIQVDNLSTMNISGISSSNDSESTGSAQTPAPTQPHNFFFEEDRSSLQDQSSDVQSAPASENKSREGTQPKTKTNRVFTSSPICSRTTSPEPRVVSPAFLTQWRSEFNERIALQDEQEKLDIKILRENAKSELQIWYQNRQSKIDERHKLHLENQTQVLMNQTDDRSIWARMASLAFELQKTQKPDEKRKDTSKMKCLLQLLAVKGPIRTS